MMFPAYLLQLPFSLLNTLGCYPHMQRCNFVIPRCERGPWPGAANPCAPPPEMGNSGKILNGWPNIATGTIHKCISYVYIIIYIYSII